MKRLTAMLLCLCLIGALLAGCNSDPDAYVPTGDALEYDDDYTGPTVAPTEDEEIQDISLTYYPNVSMNPYTCADYTNRALFSLIYQGLFTVDRDYNVSPMLCKSYRVSDDLRIYTFLLERATFSDGTPVTAQDVLDSLNAAKKSKVYGGRFLQVDEMKLSEDGGVTIQMAAPYENLPLLLDIPIMKSEELEMPTPKGTGPYVFTASGSRAFLQRTRNWWCDAKLVINAETITLTPAESINQIRDNFQFGDLDIVCADPGSDRYADYRCDYELWDCENGIFLYMIYSGYSKIFKNEQLRAAVTYAIDRDTLVMENYRGFAQAATLPASPSSPYYNQNLANRYGYNPEKFAQAVEDANLADKKVRILVNSDDSMRTRTAHAICDMLAAGGLEPELIAISGNAYQYTLNAWDFDIYIGQTILSPNMDLTQFFFAYGTLRQGNTGDAAAYTLSQQALENHGNFYTLHQEVMDRGLICPILFRSYAVYATRGLVTDLTPARDNIFYYDMGKTMEDARIN